MTKFLFPPRRPTPRHNPQTDDEELARLPKSYIFGGTDAALDSRHELYDVVANGERTENL